MDRTSVPNENQGGVDNHSFEMAETPEGTGGVVAPSNEDPKLSYRGSKVSVDMGKSVGGVSGASRSDTKKQIVGGTQRGNIVSKVIEGIRSGIYNIATKNKSLVRMGVMFLLFLGYNAYLVSAIAYTVRHELSIAWCDGLGFLLVLTGIVYWSFFYYAVLKGYWGHWLNNNLLKPLGKVWGSIFSRWWVGTGISLLLFAGIIAFVVIDCWGEPRRLVSASGVFVLLFIIFILSKHPGDVQWKQVFSGLAIQFIFGILVLRWEGGRSFLECISTKITKFLAFADVGSEFIYNFAASGELKILNSTAVPALTGTSLIIPTTFAFTSLSVIFYFSFVVQLLYHIGAMLWVVRKVGWILQIILGTSAAESMNAAANIFLGQTEAPLLIKPFMNDLTTSELHAVMTGGFATIAGTVMAAYISFGVKAESLLSASVMAAPCALALSKLMYPEVEQSKTTAEQIKNAETKSEGTALDAAAKGAVDGVILIGCILANILAFVAFVALLNAILSWFGGLVGFEELSFEWILGKLFIPVALCIGIDPEESEDVALLLGLKITVNEFVAYQKLQEMGLSERSTRLSEYALCGFANFSSIGIQLGGLGALAPLRRSELANIVWRAMLTGATASLMNACVAGALLSLDETIPTKLNSTKTFGL